MEESTYSEAIEQLTLSEIFVSQMLQYIPEDCLSHAQEVVKTRIEEGEKDLRKIFRYVQERFLNKVELEYERFKTHLDYLRFLHEYKPKTLVDPQLRTFPRELAFQVDKYLEISAGRNRPRNTPLARELANEECHIEVAYPRNGSKRKEVGLVILRRKDTDRGIRKVASRLIKGAIAYWESVEELIENLDVDDLADDDLEHIKSVLWGDVRYDQSTFREALEDVLDEEDVQKAVWNMDDLMRGKVPERPPDDWFGIKVITYTPEQADQVAGWTYTDFKGRYDLKLDTEQLPCYNRQTGQLIPGKLQSPGMDNHDKYGKGRDHNRQIKVCGQLNNSPREIAVNDYPHLLHDEMEHRSYCAHQEEQLSKLLRQKPVYRKVFDEFIRCGKVLDVLLPQDRRSILFPQELF